MKVRKKANIELEAIQLAGDGRIVDDQGVERKFYSGWWLLTTEDGRQWPVDCDYFYENYEAVGDGES